VIFAKSFLAGVAALIVSALLIYGLAVAGPRILELLPTNEGGVGVLEGPWIPLWLLLVAALLIFAGGAYWYFRRAKSRR